MKTKFWFLVFLMNAMVAGAQTNLTTLLQQGLFEEQANRNLDAAIADYQTLATQFDKDREVAATAIFRLGECYRMQNNTNEAAQEYQRIIRDFSDQTTLATLSRENLIGMGMAAENTTPMGVPVPVKEGDTNAVSSDVLVDTEDQKIQYIQAMIQNSPDLINGQPLYAAASAGDLRVATFLLDHGADVNAKYGGDTPLVAAAKNAQMTMVDLLLNRGADVNARGADGGPALLAATEGGYESVVKVLLVHKADVNETFTSINNGDSPLHLAVYHGFANLVGLLLTNGANVNVTNDNGRTPLYSAAQEGQVTIVQMLLNSGADVNIADNSGQVPLSATHASDMVKELLAAHADPNGGRINAPLLSAINRNDLASAELLLQAGANPNRASAIDYIFQGNRYNHASPLWMAVVTDELPMVQLLLKYKADVNDTQTDNQSLLFDSLGDTNILEALLDAGATVDATNMSNQRATPLEIAAAENETNAAAILLNHGADPNYCDLRDETPLHYALRNHPPNDNIFKLLLNHQADPNVRDQWGNTPLFEIKQRLSASPKYFETFEQRQQRELDSTHQQIYIQLEDLLRQHGALDVLPDWDHVSVSRPSAKYTSAIFDKGTNDWNQFTLFDLLGVQYNLLTAYPSANLFQSPTIYGKGKGGNSLPFPDFARIVIHRPQITGTNWNDIRINLAQALDSGDCSADVPLRFGDVVEIPETDHVINQVWGGPSTNELFRMKNCLTRHLQITVNGHTTNIVLAPQVKEIQPNSVGYINWGQSFPYEPEITVLVEPYMLWPVLNNSQLLLASSDLSLVTVKRRDATGKTREWTVDCSDPTSPPNFWLRDGDEIVVPEK